MAIDYVETYFFTFFFKLLFNPFQCKFTLYNKLLEDFQLFLLLPFS